MNWIKKVQAFSPKKQKLSVVEMKKAVRVLEGFGKPVCAIEAMPNGTFRVVVQNTGDAASEDNPFDAVLE